MKSKKAISDILTIVLVIVIAVAFIFIVSYFLISLVRGISINVEPGTFYIRNSCYDTSSNEISVYIGRRTDDSELNFSGMRILFDVEGTTEEIVFKDRVPSKGDVVGYVVIGVEEKPSRIQVSPLVERNDRIRRGSITDSSYDVEQSSNCLKVESSVENIDSENLVGSPGVPADPTKLFD